MEKTVEAHIEAGHTVRATEVAYQFIPITREGDRLVASVDPLDWGDSETESYSCFTCEGTPSLSLDGEIDWE